MLGLGLGAQGWGLQLQGWAATVQGSAEKVRVPLGLKKGKCMLGSYPLGPSLVLVLGEGRALFSLLTSATAVPRTPQRLCGSSCLLPALFLGP